MFALITKLSPNLTFAPPARPPLPLPQMLESTQARSVLSAEEELVLLIAAVCHDLDHDGFTNSYHINSQSPLAQRYNDRSGREGHRMSPGRCMCVWHSLLIVACAW